MTLKVISQVISQCRGLDPWELIECPVCGSTKFTSVDNASVWCDECNAQFLIRSTAGDPGFVVDCHTDNVHRGDCIYPEGRKTLKDRGWKIPWTNYLYAVVKTCEDPSKDAKQWFLCGKKDGKSVWEYWKGTPEQCTPASED